MATLEQRLTDVIQAIGLDIKALTLAGGGGSSAGDTIMGVFPGQTTVQVGTIRYYPRATIAITDITAWLSANAITNVVVVIKKNGIGVHTITIVAGTLIETDAVTISLLATDYLTIDVTAGNGQDLVVRLDF